MITAMFNGKAMIIKTSPNEVINRDKILVIIAEVLPKLNLVDWQNSFSFFEDHNMN
jgi:uncharacterized protein YlzI (FlbEa/FlbD family)